MEIADVKCHHRIVFTGMPSIQSINSVDKSCSVIGLGQFRGGWELKSPLSSLKI